MNQTDIIRTCSKHGEGVFKQRKSRKGSVWYACQECLREQWRKAQAKIRVKPANKEYHHEYHNKIIKIKNTLSLYLTIVLMANENYYTNDFKEDSK